MKTFFFSGKNAKDGKEGGKIGCNGLYCLCF